MARKYPGKAVFWMNFTQPVDIRGAREHCCAGMRLGLTFSCDQHESPFDCDDQLLCFNDLFEEYGIIIHDGSGTYSCVTHCPWCGATVPPSRRDANFACLDAAGMDFWSDDLPDWLRKPGWWNEQERGGIAPEPMSKDNNQD
ncbi:MAG: DUF6980 family protein [Hyphomicrobiaceae bacterium]